MTGPVAGSGREGDAFIEFHADMDKVPGEVAAGLEEAKIVAEAEGTQIGQSLGSHIGDGVKKEIKDQGPSIGGEIEKTVAKEVKKIKPPRLSGGGFFSRLFGGSNRRSLATSLAKDVEGAAEDIAAPGGPINTAGKFIGQGLTDGIGSVFNVSGKSPLIGLLIPLFAELGVLIGGLIQSLGLIPALLATLPSVIAGIGFSIGVVVLAFKGLGTAIHGAFAAKNAQELNAAIKDLTPSAQAFVKSLLPLKPLFESLQKIAQENFFKEIGTSVGTLIATIGPFLQSGFGELATALGDLFAQLANFFSSPAMQQFLSDVFPATAAWLASFGPALVTLLKGLIELADAFLPFLNTIGGSLSSLFKQLGEWLSGVAKDPATQEWLDRMKDTWDKLVELIGVAFKFVKQFLGALDKAGGNDFLTSLTDQLNQLGDFLESPAGVAGLQFLIDLLVVLGEAFIGLVELILLLGATFVAWVRIIKDEIIPAIGDFFEWIGGKIRGALEFVGQFFVNIYEAWLAGWEIAWNWVKGIPGKIEALFRDYDWAKLGRDIIHGIWNGMLELGPWLWSGVTGFFHDYIVKPAEGALNIGSPSKVFAEMGKRSAQGYLMGLDDTLSDGSVKVGDMMSTFTASVAPDVAANTSNQMVGFAPGAVQVNVNGQMTEQQAQRAGEAVGSGINTQLATRNARLQVRMI